MHRPIDHYGTKTKTRTNACSKAASSDAKAECVPHYDRHTAVSLLAEISIQKIEIRQRIGN